MKKKYLYTIVAAALLASCSEYEYDYSNLSDKNIRFRVTSGIDSRACATDSTQALEQPLIATTSDGSTLYLHPIVQSTERLEQLQREAAASYTNPKGILKESRAALTTENLTAFNVIATRYAAGALGTTAPNFIYVETATKSGAGYWETTVPYLWPANNDKLAFFAYAPGDGAGITLSSASQQGAPTIDFQVQNNPANQIDLITASAIDCTNQAQARNGVPLTFSHMLTSVKFVLASELTGTLKSVTLRGLYTSAKYVYPSAANTAGTWNFSGKSVGSITFDYTGATPAEVSLFLIPQSFGEDASVEAVYNNGTKDITLRASLKNQDWTAGSSVTYKISDSAVNSMKLGNISFPGLDKTGLPKTNYVNGDKAGLYVVDAQGNILTNNAMLTYDGTAWSTNAAMPYSADYDYYVYYPYSSAGLANTSNTPSGARQLGRATVFDHASSATTFFAPGIEAWTPAEDQSTAASFTASDLHIAKGYLSTTDVTGIDFIMGHAMGLAQIILGKKNVGVQRYLSIDSDYKWYDITATATSVFSGSNIPYKYNNTNYYAWLKPGSSTTFSSSSTETDAWKESLTYTNITANNRTSKTAYSKREPSSASATSYTLAVGDILYSDGSLGKPNSLLSGKTPVAIVFMATTNASSPVTTTKDRTANSSWKHGYAMALKNVHSSGSTVGTYTWGSTSTDVSGIINTSTSTWQTRTSDMEGRTNTSFINTSSYPAGYAAMTTYKSQVAAPSGTSGWFLPSSGQWYNILVNLGGMAAEPDNSYYWSGNTSSNFTSKICATALNNKISVVGAGNYDAFFSNTSSYEGYWSSSEASSSDAYRASFNSNGSMVFAGYDDKSYTNRVRAVLAF